MEVSVINEDKIQEFIKANDKRIGTELDKHRELIIRLLEYKISKSKIYNFIYENDNSIPNLKNFYKYIDKHILNKSKSKTEKKISINNQNKALKTQETKKTTQTTIEDRKTATTTPIITKTATQILSQDFDLLAFSE